MSPRKRATASLRYRDSSDPGTITLTVADQWRPGVIVEHRMTIKEAAELSQRLDLAVKQSGYELVARPRKER